MQYLETVHVFLKMAKIQKKIYALIRNGISAKR